MATKTFTKISTYDVGSGGSSTISFSSIPNTYTHLYLIGSLRGTYAGVADNITVTLNGTGVTYIKSMYNAAGTGNVTATSDPFVYVGTGGDTSTFSGFELTINNYKSNSEKPIYGQNLAPKNSTDGYMFVTGTTVATSSAVTSISLAPQGGGNWVQFSTVTLYGLTNS